MLVWIAAILLIVTVRVFYPLIVILFRHLILVRLYGNIDKLRRLGDWAAVTGATDGIGREYARRLASIGLNIVLLSRSQERLDMVADEIRQEFKVEVRTIKADFSQPDIYDNIGAQLKDLDLGILVNNVGMNQHHPEEFHTYCTKVIPDYFINMIRINVLSTVKMTHIVLPGMSHRQRGLIINISSFSARKPLALVAVYAAAKKCIDWFSLSLAQEVRVKSACKGVSIQSVLPMYVQTKFIGKGFAPPRLFTLTPQEFVAQALPLALIEKHSSGCLSHDIQLWLLDLVPDRVRMYFAYLSYIKRAKTVLAADPEK